MNGRVNGAARDGMTAAQVASLVQEMIKSGQLGLGDRLPPEREFASRLGISRPSLRAGLRTLVGFGVLEVRRGKGTFVAAGPPALASEQLTMLAALHGFTLDDIFEARRVLEMTLAGLAAERAADEHLIIISEEVTSMFALTDRPQQFLEYDIRFHRAVAAAAQSPILAALVEMVSAMHYEQRQQANSLIRNLKESAETHQRIYRAIRARDSQAARDAMREHIIDAQKTHERELNLAAAKTTAGKKSRPTPPIAAKSGGRGGR